MRFYEFTHTTREVSRETGDEILVHTKEWFGSERDAVVRRMELWNAGKLTGKKKDHEIWPVDIPTRKEDMLAWLRANCV